MGPSTRKGDHRTKQSLRGSGNWCRATYPTALATVAVPLGKNAPLMEQNCPVSSSAKVNFPAPTAYHWISGIGLDRLPSLFGLEQLFGHRHRNLLKER